MLGITMQFVFRVFMVPGVVHRIAPVETEEPCGKCAEDEIQPKTCSLTKKRVTISLTVT